MVIFEIFYKTKSYLNIHQKAPNCTILKNFLRGTYPRTPLTKCMAYSQIIKRLTTRRHVATTEVIDQHVIQS